MQRHQFWKCHSACDRGGDIVNFEQAITGITVAGAAISSVEQLLGTRLGEPKLVSQPKPRAPKKILETYAYQNADGTVRYEVVRFEPKEFGQRHRDESGKYVWNLKDVEPTIFNLPNVLRAQLVFVVEGEKDVRALQAWDAVATCNSGGADEVAAELRAASRR